MTYYAELGTVSHATMSTEDLIPAFMGALDELAKNDPDAERRERMLSLLAGLNTAIADDPDFFESEDAYYVLNEDLFPALDEYAAPYCYFGSHPGDGSDYGYWPSGGR